MKLLKCVKVQECNNKKNISMALRVWQKRKAEGRRVMDGLVKDFDNNGCLIGEKRGRNGF